jgi:sterol desaturase/sphingolipid hydroxylase (fatty acid hydroxylase superfamily)
VPPTLERMVTFLLGQPVLTFVLYAIILDWADYWRHRLSHRFGWWWALHSLHHAQRQMTFWSDDRNHLLDDLIAFVWFLGKMLWDFVRVKQKDWMIHGAIAVMLAILSAGWYEHNLGDGEILTLFLAVMGCGYAAMRLGRIQSGAAG